jgi:paraquat-inducible protein B
VADRPHEPEAQDLPEAVAVSKRRFTPQLIWIIPIVAVLVGGWLAAKAILERGPTITIRFKTAEGLEAGKTKIKYKDVEIGVVKTIALSEDRKGVVAKAELVKEAEEFLVEDTHFFVVRPRVIAGGISGLGTLLSGPYIGMDIGRAKETRHNFIGLEEAPIVASTDPGRQFVLRAEDVGSIEVGTNVYFRRAYVGEVVSSQLDKDGKGVTFKIFIHAPYDQYVTEYTRFWNASGIDVALDVTGIQVRTESLASILIGGIAFQTLPEAPPVSPAAADTVFTLFADRTQAFKRPDLVVDTYLLVFDGSVRGLSVGAPVDFRGLTVGEVTRIGVAIDPRTLVFSMPVEVKLFPDRLRARHFIGGILPPPESETVRKDRIRQFVTHGLRAQLRTGNLLTGQLYVALDFFPDVPKATIDLAKKPPEIPTIPGTFEELQETLTGIVKKLDKLQIEEIGGDARKVLASLDETLKGVDVLLKSVDANLVPDLRRTLDTAAQTLKSAEGTLKSAEGTLNSVSPLQADLQQTLRELDRTLTAVRALAEMLQQHPESLIRGKPAPASP